MQSIIKLHFQFIPLRKKLAVGNTLCSQRMSRGLINVLHILHYCTVRVTFTDAIVLLFEFRYREKFNSKCWLGKSFLQSLFLLQGGLVLLQNNSFKSFFSKFVNIGASTRPTQLYHHRLMTRLNEKFKENPKFSLVSALHLGPSLMWSWEISFTKRSDVRCSCPAHYSHHKRAIITLTTRFIRSNSQPIRYYVYKS